jgi:hypothetical protein
MKLPQTRDYSTAAVSSEPRSHVRAVLYWFARFIDSPELAARFRDSPPRPLNLDKDAPRPVPFHDSCGCAPDSRPPTSRPDPFQATGRRRVFRRTAAGMRLPAGDTEIEAD